MSIAIDRFAARPLSDEDEARALATARLYLRNSDPNLLLGYLESSVAIALEGSRCGRTGRLRRLAVDLRAVQIAEARR